MSAVHPPLPAPTCPSSLMWIKLQKVLIRVETKGYEMENLNTLALRTVKLED